jgi:hypothetical protein
MSPLQFYVYLGEQHLFLESAESVARFFDDAASANALLVQHRDSGLSYKVADEPALLALIARYDAVGRLTSEETEVVGTM